VRPKIWVYDPPLAMTTGYHPLYGQPDSNPGCLHRAISNHANATEGIANAYMAQSYLHERILRSQHHTVDPAEADFFFIPMYQQCLSHSGAHVASYAEWMLSYLRTTWPHWDATGGGLMHLLVLPDDQGKCDLAAAMPAWGQVTALEHYGLSAPKPVGNNAQMTPLPCYTPGTDIVLPPPLGSRLGATWEQTHKMFDTVRTYSDQKVCEA
jgi:hypothetical protein